MVSTLRGSIRNMFAKLFCIQSVGVLAARYRSPPTTEEQTEVAKLKRAAEVVFVDGSGTSALAGQSWLTSVESIDRILRVNYKIGENTGYPGSMPAMFGANLASAACNHTWNCAALEWEVCPGTKVTTAYTRAFEETPTAAFQPFVPYPAPSGYSLPTFTWVATRGKYYSLLFVDLMQPVFEGLHYFHGAWYNIDGNDMASASSQGMASPGCEVRGEGNAYVFMLFQHDEKLSDTVIAASDAASYTEPSYNFLKHLSATTLTAQNLVSANWMKVEASVVSNVVLTDFGAGDLVPASNCIVWTKGAANTATLDMCAGVTLPHSCNVFAFAAEGKD